MNMRNGAWLVSLVMGLSLVACAQEPARTPAPTQVPPPTVAPLPAVTNPQDGEWARVMRAAQKEGKVTIYSFFLTGDIGLNVEKAFEDRTGLGLDIISGSGALVFERIKSEKRGGSQIAGLVDTSVTQLYTAKTEGLLVPVGYLPAISDETMWEKNPRVDPEGAILGFGTNIVGPWVNTKYVQPGKEPQSWKELLQPTWKGKISFGDPASVGPVVRLYYALTKYAGFEDAYFRQLAKQVMFASNVRLSADSVARGETVVAFALGSTSMTNYIDEGAPVKAIDMEEGVVDSQAFGVALLDGVPQPNAARVFVDWFLSKEGQSIFNKYNRTNSLRKDVPRFLPQVAQLSPRRTIWITPEEDLQVAKLQRDRVLSKLMAEK